MKRVLTAAALIPVVLLLVFRAPLWLFAVAVAVIIAAALHEYLGMVEAAGLKPFRCLVYVAGVLPIILLLGSILRARLVDHPSQNFYPPGLMLKTWCEIAFLAALIFGIPLIFRKDMAQGLASVAASLLGILYIGASLSLLIAMRWDAAQAVLIVFVLFSVWAGDIAAYYIGRSFGKHKLAPVVSPNKSWEGAMASVIASVAVAFLVFHFRYRLAAWFSPGWPWSSGSWTFYQPLRSVPLLHVIGLGMLTNIAAQLGDLFESALKRGAGVKDSGTLLPGHGGILDRIDALLFAIPVVWYYAQLTRFLQP